MLELQPQRRLTKTEAYEITNKLYREHYNKNERFNERKIQRFKEEAKVYRNKPDINSTSKEIFKILS